MQTGVGFDRDVNLRTLADQGVTLAGRFKGADGQTAYFEDNLSESGEHSDAAANSLLKRIDAYITRAGLHAPPPTPCKPVGTLPPALIDRGQQHHQRHSSGFRLDFESWIDLDLTARRYPQQTQASKHRPVLHGPAADAHAQVSLTPYVGRTPSMSLASSASSAAP
jgi:hypothetical protein